MSSAIASTSTGLLRFEQLSDRPGLRILDDIEQARFELHCPDYAEVEATTPKLFDRAVDVAVRIHTDRLVLPKTVNMLVRDDAGRQIARGDGHDPVDLHGNGFEIEATTAPVKLYVTVPGDLSIRYDGARTVLSFDGWRRIAVGARSFHEQPAGTITTPTDPESLMDAISLLGSALKTTSPERSFPTLRGHPPVFERGEEFSAPEGITSPDTGLTLVVPPTHRAVFTSASLAYYLGATVVPGEEARLVGDGWEHSLATEDLPTQMNRALQQTFFFDCLTRTEGHYPVDLHERRQAERTLDPVPNFEELYEMPIAERVGEYLSYSFEEIEPHLPKWTLTTDIQPTPEHAEMLPFLAADLSLLRCPDQSLGSGSSTMAEAITEFCRSAPNDELPDLDESESSGSLIGGGAETTGSSIATRRNTGQDERGSTGSDDRDSSSADEPVSLTESRSTKDSDLVEPQPANSVEHAWVGDGYPLGASKATLKSYQRSLDREVEETDSIDIVVVCNDEQMREEDVVAEFYGLRDMLRFDIDVRYDLTRAELRETLQSPAHFLHYIGHVDDDGIQCADGSLDVRTMDGDVEVEAFFLNACESYEQGEALIDLGSYGGVVTLTEVTNVAATRLGQTLARLLNAGFTLRSALSIAQEELLTGHRYIVIGDGGMALCQSESGSIVVPDITRTPEDAFSVTFNFYTTPSFGMGSLVQPLVQSVVEEQVPYYISNSRSDAYELTTEQLNEFLSTEIVPVRTNSGLQWSDEISAEGL